MAAADEDFRRLAGPRDGHLRAGDAARRLDRHPADNRLAGTQAAEHPAVAVGRRVDGTRQVHVVVLAAAGRGDREPGPVLEADHGREAQQGFAEVGLELVEDRLAEAGGDADGDEFGDAADGVAVEAGVVDQLGHAVGRLGHRAADRVGFDLFEGDRRRVGDVGDDLADLFDVAEDADAGAGEQFLGDGPGGDAGNRLAGAGPAAAAVVAVAVLRVERVVGVAGPVLVGNVRVVAAALVGVAEEDADGGAVGLALEDARPDFRGVVFLPLRRQLRLARLAALQVRDQIVNAQFEAGRTAVHDAQVARAVADAGGGDAEEFAECVACHAGDCTECPRGATPPAVGAGGKVGSRLPGEAEASKLTVG